MTECEGEHSRVLVAWHVKVTSSMKMDENVDFQTNLESWSAVVINIQLINMLTYKFDIGEAMGCK
ncbi:hypothetical protein L195_g038067 [Trifolium pratense]|uniref:Uncharacterized protein n=1 Tax=Trifolium pratense TaxID=57577 RepID=A0A2K3LU31_TRIPR|nr:hypothetical protein L195_g038067 [Trifolium pratense]